MSDLRGGREDNSASRKRGVSASPGTDQSTDVAKVKQDAFTPKKYDGFGGSLGSTNVNEIKYGSFTDEPIVGSASYIPSLSDLNDNSELQELSFFNLQGVCQAEREILLGIIQNSQWYSDSLFCFMRRSPSPSAVEVDPSERCLNESSEGDGIPEVSGDPDNVPGNIPDDNPHLQNGPLVEIPQQHLPPVDEGSISGVMSPGAPPANMRTYYPHQAQMAVSSTGPGAMPPSSVPQISASSGQMVMYPHQQMQQLMQHGPGGYPVQVGYPPLHYGYPQHGGHPQVTYVTPSGEPISPESVHMTGPPPGHQKGHHDGHHAMSHTSTSGPGSGYPKGRNHRRDNVKQQQQQQQQQQQPYYYPSYGYAPGMQYHNHQQLAQNVTGSPIIMQAPGNIYPYHQAPHPSMYAQNTTGELDHHQSNVGMPQPMGHMPGGEIPQYAQQHHHVPAPQMYHHSPTHSTTSSRSSGGGGGYTQRQSSTSSTVPIEPPVNATAAVAMEGPPSSDIDNLGKATAAGDADISQSARNPAAVKGDSTERAAARVNSESNVQKKSIVTVAESIVISPEAPELGSTSGVIEPTGPKTLVNNLDSLSEPCRDTEVVDRIEQSLSSGSTIANKVTHIKGASGVVVGVVDSQTKGTLSENQEQIVNYSSVVSPSVNGELVKDIISTNKAGKNIPRDKLSADTFSSAVADTNARKDVISKSTESKVKPPPTSSNTNINSNTRSVSVVSNTSSSIAGTTSSSKDISSTEKKIESESGSGDFPQLSSNSSSNNTSIPSLPSSSNSGAAACGTGNSANTTAPTAAKGRSWASIASAKSQFASATPDGANQNSKVMMPGASLHGIDGGSGDGSRLMGGIEQYSSNYVPTSNQTEKGKYQHLDSLTDTTVISDENDPVALALGDFLRNYTLDHHSIALTPRGLCNHGNYCYINATLQSLLACPPFVNLFRSMGEILNKRPCRATPIIQNVFDLVNEFEPLLRGNASKKDRMKDVFVVGANLEPLGIRKCLGLLDGSTFKVEGRQEDAEEFLSHLLNGLHDEMLKVMKWAEQRKERSSGKPAAVPVPEIPGATNGDGLEISGDEDDDQWQVMRGKNKSFVTRKTAISKTPISEAFLGQMCYLYKESSTGSNKSATLQPFYTLQLDIQNDNIRSVKDALEAISAREEVSGVMLNGSEIEAWRQLSLEELPVVLILHLKRFVYEKNGNKIRKIDKKLDFGIDLEIGKEMLSPQFSKNKFSVLQRRYKLFGVVYHDGDEAHKGHYIADCFHASGGSMWGQCGWLRFDDTAVKQIPESQMLNPQPPRVPYLLYYRRGDTLLSHHVTQQQQHKKDRP